MNDGPPTEKELRAFADYARRTHVAWLIDKDPERYDDILAAFVSGMRESERARQRSGLLIAAPRR